MRAARIGSLLLGLGLLVGGAATVAIALGLKPSHLPSALLDIAAYKLAIAASLTLLWAGAAVVRHEKRARGADSARATATDPRVAEKKVLRAPEEFPDGRGGERAKSPATHSRVRP